MINKFISFFEEVKSLYFEHETNILVTISVICVFYIVWLVNTLTGKLI